jgi:guanylate kinase
MKNLIIEPSSIIGHLFIVVAPSGAGKSTLIDYVRQELPELYFPISATTRQPRAGEVDGQEYHFFTKAEFEHKIKQRDFLEYANVHGHTYYGTLLSEVVEPLQSGKNVIRHIDYQGARSIKKLLPNKHVHVIYIDAGNWQVLLDRIQSRTPLENEEIERRYKSFIVEQDFIPEADVVISNRTGELEQAQKTLLDYIKHLID